MSGQISIGQLQINSRFTFLSMLNCNIHSKYGKHTKAEIIGTVKSSEAITVLSNVSEDKVEIISRNDNGAEDMLFIGVIEYVEIKQEGQYALLTVKAVSYTWKMDIEKKSRSFQDLTMTYKDIAEQVLGEYGVVMSWNLSDKLMEYPLIQYKETDFCFLKRILSHLKGSISVSDTQEKENLCAGLRAGSFLGEIDLKGKNYSVVPIRENRLLGYKIENMNFARVGDVLSIHGHTYYVMEVEAVCQRNILNCTCFVFPSKCFEVERMSADTLRGTVIIGKVLKAEQEMLKLHLEIDEEQIDGTAYRFPWKPITGNLLYCMPEEGSRVALYFGEGEEKSGAAIYNIREIDGEREEIAYCGDRYFTTRHEKRMYLSPSENGFVNLKEQNAKISLKDNSCLEVKSCHKISIMAEGQIKLKGKKTNIMAQKETTLVKKDIMSPTVINLCNAFDAVGNIGDFTSISTELKVNKKRNVNRTPIERYSLNGAVETILSNIPAVEMGSTIMEAVAGSMPVISRNIR